MKNVVKKVVFGIVLSIAFSVSACADTKEVEGKLELNSATLEQLQTLEGVGHVKAQRMIEYRTLHGGFLSVGEITKVYGVGETILRNNRNKLYVRKFWLEPRSNFRGNPRLIEI